MAHFLEVLSVDGVFALRLVVAMLLGGLIGVERQTRGRAAGLRTNILVCLGSAAIIIAFQKFSMELNVGAESIVRMDPARVAAGVITGIGFLGAGMIIKTNDFVRGLTTAASIWVVSAIGVTVGLGEYAIATVATLLVLITLYVLHYLPISGDRYMSLHLRWIGDLALLHEVTDRLEEERIQIKGSDVIRQPNTGKCHVVLALRMRKEEYARAILDHLQEDTRFDEVHWS